MALAALIRNNKPGIAAFRLANGYAALREALGSESARFQRYFLSLNHQDFIAYMFISFASYKVTEINDIKVSS